jgi:hypothetical protein
MTAITRRVSSSMNMKEYQRATGFSGNGDQVRGLKAAGVNPNEKPIFLLGGSSASDFFPRSLGRGHLVAQ